MNKPDLRAELGHYVVRNVDGEWRRVPFGEYHAKAVETGEKVSWWSSGPDPARPGAWCVVLTTVRPDPEQSDFERTYFAVETLPTGLALPRGARDLEKATKKAIRDLDESIQPILHKLEPDSEKASLLFGTIDSAATADLLPAQAVGVKVLIGTLSWLTACLGAVAIMSYEDLPTIWQTITGSDTTVWQTVKGLWRTIMGPNNLPAELSDRLNTSFATATLSSLLAPMLVLCLIFPRRPDQPASRGGLWFARNWWLVRLPFWIFAFWLVLSGIRWTKGLEPMLIALISGMLIAVLTYAISIDLLRGLSRVSRLTSVSDPRARLVHKSARWVVTLSQGPISVRESERLRRDVERTASYFERTLPLTTRVLDWDLRRSLEQPARQVAAHLRTIALDIHARPAGWPELVRPAMRQLLLDSSQGRWSDIAPGLETRGGARTSFFSRAILAAILFAAAVVLPRIPALPSGVDPSGLATPLIITGVLALFGSPASSLMDRLGGAVAKGGR